MANTYHQVYLQEVFHSQIDNVYSSRIRKNIIQSKLLRKNI